MKKISTVWTFLWVFMAASYAQDNKQPTPTDSLERAFNTAASDKERLRLLVDESYGSHLGQSDKAIALYKKGYELAQRLDNKLAMARIAYSIGAIYAAGKSDEGTAFGYYQTALNISEEINDYEGCEFAHYAMGLVYDHQGFRDKMYTSFLKSFENSEKLPNPSLNPFYALISVYTNDKQMDKALGIAKRAVAMMEKPGISVSNKIAAYHGMLTVLKGMPNQAKNVDFYTQKVISILEKEPMESFADDIAIVMEICFRVKRYDLTIKCANYLLSKKGDSKANQTAHSYAYQFLAEVYEVQKKYPLSIEYYKKYMALTTKLNLQTATEDAGRKVIKAEAERDLLLKQNELDKQKWFAISGFCVAMVMLLACFVVYHFYKREQKTKQALVKLNATKDKLFAILSHDLRSPVGNLESNLTLINWGALSQEEFMNATRSLGQELSQVRTMLDNVLQWAISQMDGLKPKPTITDLAATTQSLIQLMSPNSTAKNVQILNSVPDNTTLLTDPNHLSVILRNLLQNALKFTPTGGHVQVSARTHDDHVRIEVNDTGIGMSEEQITNLFRLNTASSRLGTSLEQGTGLGLVLVKELVDINQGAIQAISQEGKGTSFVVTLPRAVA